MTDRERRIRTEAARAAVKDLLEERNTLRSASAEIGDPLTLEAIEAAFSKRSTDDHVRVQLAALSWAATACCNQFNVIIQAGSVLAGFRPPEPPGEQPPSATEDYRLLRDNGVITQAQRQLLSDLNSARIALTHRYGQPKTPNELYQATSLASRALSTFAKDYGPWLQGLGVLPSGK
ncbi:MAG TPA: hypothetical protein VFY47_01995 [Thermoleophilaceae bacterium]|nr:hypothetical protein [Thermoleophilaceae bacterium]